jgi:hypothetical protein
MKLAEHIVDVLLEAMPRSLKVNVQFTLEDGTLDVAPGFVSKEVRPPDARAGEWRVTLFDEDFQPLGHVNFSHDDSPFTAQSINRALATTTVGPDGHTVLLQFYNANASQLDKTFATHVTVKPGFSAPPA